MTIVFAARLEGRNALLADVFVTEGDERYSVVEKVFPCSWTADTYLAGLGDELFLLLLRGGLGDGPKKFSWPPLSSLDLNSAASMDVLARMATDYRRLLREHKQALAQNSAAVYVVDRTSVFRWQFEAGAEDSYKLVLRQPERIPEGYAFVDAGSVVGPLWVAPQLGQAGVAEMVAFIDSQSTGLPYEVGTGVTGVVLPHDGALKPEARCLCGLSLEERTPKPKIADNAT